MNENIENAVLKEAPILPEAELQKGEMELLFADEIPSRFIGGGDMIELVGTPDQVQKMFAAWSKYIGEVSNPCNSKDNPFYKSAYAPLSEVFDTVRPVLGKFGLGIMQSPQYIPGTGVQIQTIVLHEEGGAMVFPILTAPVKVQNDVNAVASALTYGKRIALNAIVCVAGANEDDDAQGATGNKGTTTKKSKASKSNVDPALAEARAKLLDLCKKRSGEVADKEEIYKVIVKYCGNRNPNVMQSVEDCTAATEEIKKLK